jgi:hypothetical protein
MTTKQTSLMVPSLIVSNELHLDEDVLHVCCVGELDLPQMKQLVAVYDQCIDHFGYLLLLLDVERSTGMDMTSRRYGTDWAKHVITVQSSAVYGAGMIARGLLTMLNRATFLLARGKQSAMEFVGTEELGRQWLQAQRPLMVKAAMARSLDLQKAQVAGSTDD